MREVQHEQYHFRTQTRCSSRKPIRQNIGIRTETGRPVDVLPKLELEYAWIGVRNL